MGSFVLIGKLDGEFVYVNLGEDSSNYVLFDIYLFIYFYVVSKELDVEVIKFFFYLKDNWVVIENCFVNMLLFRLLKDIKWLCNFIMFDVFC